MSHAHLLSPSVIKSNVTDTIENTVSPMLFNKPLAYQSNNDDTIIN